MQEIEVSNQVIQTSKAPAAIGPYSQAIVAPPGALVFTSGQIAIDPETGALVLENVTTETRRVMDNLAAVLEAAQVGFENVVSTTIYLASMVDFQAVNEVYGSYFPEGAPKPARATVEVGRLPKDVRVEISCVAVRPMTSG
jgi:2-iminobutanoate/2-iminopropanoate deaminase